MLGERPTEGISGTFDELEEKFSINFSKENIKFCLSWQYDGDHIYLFVNENEIYE